MLLAVDAPRLRALFPTTHDPLGRMTTLEAATGRRPTFAEVATALRDAFEAEHGLTLVPGGLTAEETARAGGLARDRYGSDAFLTTPASPVSGAR